ncbi:hypothetical protein [Devosia sp. SL43]|uniref:hypothetical protein n=1 Tax=Devosia sp. SL43 TaxID=2806348 RepID=UPI001F2BA09A|nr:hypothetical protein [Devosia sp. SL43]UJW85204.1 hypothetical protein IM737_17655 [Devosia sp. SL43]
MTRRNVWLALVSVFIGPLIGSLTFVAAALAWNLLFYGTDPSANFLLRNWPIVFTSGYVFGFVPALAFAIAMAFLSRQLPKLHQRLIAAPIVGALLSIAILSLVLFGQSFGGFDLAMLLILGSTGAVAGLVCQAIIEPFHPLTAPVQGP